MKKYLLPENGKFYKVNMHSHTTLSDGKTTPEETKEAYKAMDYSGIAFTEHNWSFDVSYLNDEDFVAIRSYEYDIQNPHKQMVEGINSPNHVEHVHLNFFAKDPANGKVVCMAENKLPKKHPELMDLSQIVGEPNFKQEFNPDCLNKIIRTAKENGYLVVYNHPIWSLNEYPVYMSLEGLDGVEINNGWSNRDTDLDYTPYIYDYMSRKGKRLFCLGGDDNHNADHFGLAWTMIKADKLDQKSLMEAVERGDCYASDGPEIKELYFEDGYVTIKTSEAAGIYLTTVARRHDNKLAVKTGAPVTEATFKIYPNDHYFRLTVKDDHGNHANTRAFFLDEVGM